ncbi:Arc family DNA-binding protein [Candidatus Acetothermia bacterium]|nr:Arc family DNA-binding protein [Candidatus Acetothermia bacterium]MBI3660098.1 Arc family DNA-binding protein [Candidatus Acetothermia bacterium]
MPNILIRDVPDKVLKTLKERAIRQHRSLQQELRAILEDSVKHSAHEALAGTRRLRRKLTRSGRTFSDSVHLLREDRRR